LQKDIVDLLNWRLIPEQFDLTIVDPVPEGQEEKRKDLAIADKIHAMTINEKRIALGLTEIKGGDEILVPLNLVSLSSQRESPEEEKKN